MYNQNTKRFNFDEEKALEVLLYIASKNDDLYAILKILYDADKLHLSKYGRFINGDCYVAMKNGPVPSQTYDIIKLVRGDGIISYDKLNPKEAFSVKNDSVYLKRKPEMDLISESNLECLNAVIKEYEGLTFPEIWNKHHDKDYVRTDREYPIEEIIKKLPNKDEISSFLTELYS